LKEQYEETSEELERPYDETRKANPWIWTGSRRPRPVTPQHIEKMEKNPPTNLKQLLQNVLVQDIAILNWLRKRPVLISAKQNIERALYKIMKHEVHALPVADDNGEVFGIIDVEDLARPIISILKDDPLTGVVRVNSDVMGRHVSSLFVTQLEKKTYLISNQTSLWNAMNHFIRLDVKRYLIVDREIYEEAREQSFPENKIDGLLTYSDVFRFLANNSTWMKSEPLFQKTLSELKLGNTEPVVISSQEFAGTAFAILKQKRRTNAAIVDSNGKLVSTLSFSDLKGLNRKNSFVLNLTIENFFMRDKKKPWWERPSVVGLEVSFYEMILQFNLTHRHVVFIVDKNDRPVGEVNHSDALLKLLTI